MSFALKSDVKDQLRDLPMDDRASTLTFATPANTAAPVPAPTAAPKKTLG